MEMTTFENKRLRGSKRPRTTQNSLLEELDYRIPSDRLLRHRRHGDEFDHVEANLNQHWDVDGEDTIGEADFLPQQSEGSTFVEVEYCDGLLKSDIESNKQSYGSMFDIKTSYNHIYINGFDLTSTAADNKVDYRVYTKLGTYQSAHSFDNWKLVDSNSILAENGVAKIRWIDPVAISPASLQSFYVAFKTSTLSYGFATMSRGTLYAANENLELRLGAAVDWSGQVQEKDVLWTGSIYYTAAGKCPTMARIFSATYRIQEAMKISSGPSLSSGPTTSLQPSLSPSSSPAPSVSIIPSREPSMSVSPSFKNDTPTSVKPSISIFKSTPPSPSNLLPITQSSIPTVTTSQTSSHLPSLTPLRTTTDVPSTKIMSTSPSSLISPSLKPAPAPTKATRLPIVTTVASPQPAIKEVIFPSSPLTLTPNGSVLSLPSETRHPKRTIEPNSTTTTGPFSSKSPTSVSNPALTGHPFPTLVLTPSTKPTVHFIASAKPMMVNGTMNSQGPNLTSSSLNRTTTSEPTVSETPTDTPSVGSKIPKSSQPSLGVVWPSAPNAPITPTPVRLDSLSPLLPIDVTSTPSLTSMPTVWAIAPEPTRLFTPPIRGIPTLTPSMSTRVSLSTTPLQIPTHVTATIPPNSNTDTFSPLSLTLSTFQPTLSAGPNISKRPSQTPTKKLFTKNPAIPTLLPSASSKVVTSSPLLSMESLRSKKPSSVPSLSAVTQVPTMSPLDTFSPSNRPTSVEPTALKYVSSKPTKISATLFPSRRVTSTTITAVDPTSDASFIFPPSTPPPSTAAPTKTKTSNPTVSRNPLPKPSQAPVSKPSEDPVPKPSEDPVPKPNDAPVPKPSQAPVPKPSQAPVPKPSQAPVPKPSQAPVPKPSKAPVPQPSNVPVPKPSNVPVPKPSDAPVPKPSDAPVPKPSQAPVPKPSQAPVLKPSNVPAPNPSYAPIPKPSNAPVPKPGNDPDTLLPQKSVRPTIAVSEFMSIAPTTSASRQTVKTSGNAVDKFSGTTLPITQNAEPSATPSRVFNSLPSKDLKSSILTSSIPSSSVEIFKRNPTVRPSVLGEFAPNKAIEPNPSPKPTLDVSRNPMIGAYSKPSALPSPGQPYPETAPKTNIPSKAPTKLISSTRSIPPTSLFQTLIPSDVPSVISQLPTESLVCALVPRACEQPSLLSSSPTLSWNSLVPSSVNDGLPLVCILIPEECQTTTSLPIALSIPSSSPVPALTLLSIGDPVVSEAETLAPTTTNEFLASLPSQVPTATVSLVCALLPSACEPTVPLLDLTSSPFPVKSAANVPSISSSSPTITWVPTSTTIPSTIVTTFPTEGSTASKPSLMHVPTKRPKVTTAPSSERSSQRPDVLIITRPSRDEMPSIGTNGSQPSNETNFKPKPSQKRNSEFPSTPPSLVPPLRGEFPTERNIQNKTSSPSAVIVERSCPEFGEVLNLVDEEVPFRYTVETTAFTAIFVPEFELLLLHAVADALLTCQSLLKSNQRILDAELQHRILRLAYPQDKRASLINPCNPANVAAQSCWDIISTFVVSTDAVPEKPARDEVILVLRQVFSNTSFISSAIPAGLVVTFEEELLPLGNTPPPTLVPQKYGQPCGGNSSVPTVLIIGLALGGAVILAIACLIIRGRKRHKDKVNKLIIGPEGNFSGELAPEMYADLSPFAGNDFLTDRESERSPLLDDQSESQHGDDFEDSRYTASSRAISHNHSRGEGAWETSKEVEESSLKSVANKEECVQNSVDGPSGDIDIEETESVHSDISDRSGDYDGSHYADHNNTSYAGQARQEFNEASLADESKEGFPGGSFEDNKKYHCAEQSEEVTAIEIATAAGEEPHTEGKRSATTSISSDRQRERIALKSESKSESDEEPSVDTMSHYNDHVIEDCSQESGNIDDMSSFVDEIFGSENDASKGSQVDGDENIKGENDHFFSDSSQSEESTSICEYNASDVEINVPNIADGIQDDEVGSSESITNSEIHTFNDSSVARQHGDDMFQNASQTDCTVIIKPVTTEYSNADDSHTDYMDASVDFDDDASYDRNEHLEPELKNAVDKYKGQTDPFHISINSFDNVERRSADQSCDNERTAEIGAAAIDHRESFDDKHGKEADEPEEIRHGYGMGTLNESSAIPGESGLLRDISVVDALNTGHTGLVQECGEDLKLKSTSLKESDSGNDSFNDETNISYVTSADSSLAGANAIVAARRKAEENDDSPKEKRTVDWDESEGETHVPIAPRYECTTIGLKNYDESFQSDDELGAGLEQANDFIHGTEQVKDESASRDDATDENSKFSLNKPNNDMEMYSSDDDYSVSERSWTCDQSVPQMGPLDHVLKNDNGNGDDESERTWSDYGPEGTTLSRISESAEGSFATHIEDFGNNLINDELRPMDDKWSPSGNDYEKIIEGINQTALVTTNLGKVGKYSNVGDEGEDSHQSETVEGTTQMGQTPPELNSSIHSPLLYSERSGSIYEHSAPCRSHASSRSNDDSSFQSESNKSYDCSVDSEGDLLESKQLDEDSQSQTIRSYRSSDHSVNSHRESISHSSFHDDVSLFNRSESYQTDDNSVDSQGEPILHRSFHDDESYSQQSYSEHSLDGDEHSDDSASDHSETSTKPQQQISMMTRQFPRIP